MLPKQGPAHNRARLPHNCAHLFGKSSVFTNPVIYFEISLPIINFAKVCLAITENNALTTVAPVTHKYAKYTCFGVKSTRSVTTTFTCPVGYCAMLGLLQVISHPFHLLSNIIEEVRYKTQVKVSLMFYDNILSKFVISDQQVFTLRSGRKM